MTTTASLYSKTVGYPQTLFIFIILALNQRNPIQQIFDLAGNQIIPELSRNIALF